MEKQRQSKNTHLGYAEKNVKSNRERSYFFAVLLVHVVTLLSDGLKIEGEVHQNKCEGDILPVDGVLPPGETRDDVRNERKRRLFVSSYLKGRYSRPGRSREETRARRRRPETIDKMRDENKEEKRHRREEGRQKLERRGRRVGFLR